MASEIFKGTLSVTGLSFLVFVLVFFLSCLVGGVEWSALGASWIAWMGSRRVESCYRDRKMEREERMRDIVP